MENLLSSYLDLNSYKIIDTELIGQGNINQTYKVNTYNIPKKQAESYILQHINKNIFRKPDVLTQNMLQVYKNLKTSAYPYHSIKPLRSKLGRFVCYDEHGRPWRLMPFIDNSICYSRILNPEMAYNAAACFSQFYAALWDNPLHDFTPSLPDFLNFEKRIKDFKKAVSAAGNLQKTQAKEEIRFLQQNLGLLNRWIILHETNQFPKHLIHGDPKISNVLFDTESKNAMAIIDLDTMMPGSVLYDFGDMVRSYCQNYADDDPNEKSALNHEIYRQVRDGFLSALEPKLELIELENMTYAAQCVVYIQSIRFLTDFLKGNVYYKVQHELQNLHRAQNQINLLKELLLLEK